MAQRHPWDVPVGTAGDKCHPFVTAKRGKVQPRPPNIHEWCDGTAEVAIQGFCPHSCAYFSHIPPPATQIPAGGGGEEGSDTRSSSPRDRCKKGRMIRGNRGRRGRADLPGVVQGSRDQTRRLNTLRAPSCPRAPPAPGSSCWSSSPRELSSSPYRGKARVWGSGGPTGAVQGTRLCRSVSCSQAGGSSRCQHPRRSAARRSEHPPRCPRAVARGGARNSAAAGPAGCRAWQGDRHRLQQREPPSPCLQEMSPAGDRPSCGAAARPLAAPPGTTSIASGGCGDGKDEGISRGSRPTRFGV